MLDLTKITFKLCIIFILRGSDDEVSKSDSATKNSEKYRFQYADHEYNYQNPE